MNNFNNYCPINVRKSFSHLDANTQSDGGKFNNLSMNQSFNNLSNKLVFMKKRRLLLKQFYHLVVYYCISTKPAQ